MSTYIWLPNDPVNFVALNYEELKDLADYVCKKEWDKRDFLSFVMNYFLTHPLNYKKDYENKDGYRSKISTYIFKTMKFVKLKYYYQIEDRKEGRTQMEDRIGLVPVEYVERRKRVMSETASESSDVFIYIQKNFKKYLQRQRNLNWLKNGFKVLDLGLQGFGNTDISGILGITVVRVSQLKRKLRVAFDNFRERDNLCVI